MDVRRAVSAAIIFVGLAPGGRAQTPPADRLAPAASDRPNFSGDWTLNRELSDEPAPRSADDDQAARGARRGEYGGHGGGGRYGRRGGYGGGYGGGRGPNPEPADERAKIAEAIA